MQWLILKNPALWLQLWYDLYFQYLSLKVGEERQQLVPVLTTMLKLSPEEKGRLEAAAQGKFLLLIPLFTKSNCN